MKTLVIGAGEVGKALRAIFETYHETFIKDIDSLNLDGVEALHICYPDSERFVEITKSYIEQYKPDFTVIHSSIKIGTCDQFDANVVYSPVRGRHYRINPFTRESLNGLEFDIPRYEKFIFGERKARQKAKTFFQLCGIQCYDYDCEKRSDGEALKLISNVHMGLEIAWRQEVQRILEHYNISEFSYYNWESSYNEGYMKCGDSNLIRPLMKPAPIGGHCIIPCTEILSQQFKSKAFEFILESNEKAQADSVPENR